MPIIEDALRNARKLKAEVDEIPLIEKLAAIEHDQWIAWSRDMAAKEDLSPLRIRRWKVLWTPYELLTDEYKEMDRKWARKVLDVIHQNGND